jgi:predicted metal-dependent hydrolase
MSDRSVPADPSVVFRHNPRARRYVIRVTDDGHVRATIPRRGSRKGALAFVDSQRAWIDKQRRRLERERREWETRGDCGLRMADSTPAQVRRWGPRDCGLQIGECEDRLRARATRELPPRLLELAARFGLHVRRISIRNQKWRWGSCSSSGHICLNWRLVQMPRAVRDYVLIHELMHLKRLDHSPKFWSLVASACPDYRELRRQLSAFSRQPSAANPGWTARAADGSAFEHAMQVDAEPRVASCAGDDDRDRAAAAGSLEQRIDDLQQQRSESADGL